MTLEFTCLADPKCRVGECPVYDERTGLLYFVDILDCTLFALMPETGALSSWRFESEVGSFGLTASGALVVALRHSIIRFDPATQARETICEIEPDLPTRNNDGKVGPDGAFWIGTMDDRPQKEPIGALYRVDASGKVERKVEGLTIANGLAWTPDGAAMFHSDSRGPWVDRWDFDSASGEISGRSRFAAPDGPIGRPDGGTCDAEGCYWSAGVSGGRLNRFAPDGSLVASYEAPMPAPTMPCFGGKDFRTLFLTGLTEGRAPELLGRYSAPGGIFAAPAPVAGFPASRFLDI